MSIVLKTGFVSVSHNIKFQPQTVFKGKLLVLAGQARDVEELRTKQGQSSIIHALIIRQTSITLPPYKTVLNLNEQRPPIDRFVAPRHSFPELRRRLLWDGREHTVDIWSKKSLQKKKFTNYLNEAFGLEPVKVWRTGLQDDCSIQSWPCVPRKKAFLSSADSILDLPMYGTVDFPDLLDWSNKNILVACLGCKYYRWNWETQGRIKGGVSLHEILCCRFDPRGEKLILGTTKSMIECHETLRSDVVTDNYCRCYKNMKYCSITAVDWSPTGKAFATGCIRGVVGAHDRNLHPISWRRATKSALLIVRVSPDARYVAVSTVEGAEVILLSWPNLELLCGVTHKNWTVKSFEWHPWRSAFLGIGAVSYDMQTRIVLWDAPTSKIQEKNLTKSNYILDSMLFSPRTGELVLSLWHSDPATSYERTFSQLVVMSDLETVVDQWGEGRTRLDRVRKMVFSPDGTNLATATVDEDLIIWNFLPKDKNEKKTSRTKFTAMPIYLDTAEDGISEP